MSDQINQFNRRAPGMMSRLSEMVAFIPRRFIVVPERRQINDITELVAQVRNLALRRLLINIITIIIVLASVYKFYNSELFFNMVTTSGHAKFIKNYANVLLYIYDVTKLLQQKFPSAFNTINMVVPAFSAKLLSNVLTDLPGTINRYKTLGMKRRNVLSLSGAAAVGVALNAGKVPGGSLVSAAATLSIEGMRMFVKQTSTMNLRDIERAYGAVTTTGWKQIRDYIEGITGQAIRNGIVSSTTIILDNAASASVSAYVLTATNEQLLKNLERMGVGVNRAERDTPMLANRPHQN